MGLFENDKYSFELFVINRLEQELENKQRQLEKANTNIDNNLARWKQNDYELKKLKSDRLELDRRFFEELLAHHQGIAKQIIQEIKVFLIAFEEKNKPLKDSVLIYSEETSDLNIEGVIIELLKLEHEYRQRKEEIFKRKLSDLSFSLENIKNYRKMQIKSSEQAFEEMSSGFAVLLEKLSIDIQNEDLSLLLDEIFTLILGYKKALLAKIKHIFMNDYDCSLELRTHIKRMAKKTN